LKEEALDRTMWRVLFGRGFGPVIRQDTKLMNELSLHLVCNLLSFIAKYVFIFSYKLKRYFQLPNLAD
jgi:hypothetical protein